ncbi:MAG: hypothetical protein K9N21_02760 [Deltaproteobacteria bacterium]|nr:hypothetical protein [Deltaproteobacteria bacterium]
MATKSDKVWILSRMIKGKAFRSLSRWALLTLMDLFDKRVFQEVKRSGRASGWIIKNNGEIVYPYSEAERWGISRKHFRDAIDELIEKGFLKINHQGGGGHKGDVTTYFLRDEWENYGTSKFNPINGRKPDKRLFKGWASHWNNPVKKAALLKKQEAARLKKQKNRKC